MNVEMLKEFYDYCCDYYCDGGIFDMGAKPKQVLKAIEIYLSDPVRPFEGDSMDRESISAIMQSRFGLDYLHNQKGA